MSDPHARTNYCRSNELAFEAMCMSRDRTLAGHEPKTSSARSVADRTGAPIPRTLRSALVIPAHTYLPCSTSPLSSRHETLRGASAQHSCPCEAVGAVCKFVERRGFKERWCRTVDYAVKIRVNPDQKGVDLNVKHSMVRVHRYPQACRLNPRRVAEPL